MIYCVMYNYNCTVQYIIVHIMVILWWCVGIGWEMSEGSTWSTVWEDSAGHSDIDSCQRRILRTPTTGERGGGRVRDCESEGGWVERGMEGGGEWVKEGGERRQKSEGEWECNCEQNMYNTCVLFMYIKSQQFFIEKLLPWEIDLYVFLRCLSIYHYYTLS